MFLTWYHSLFQFILFPEPPFCHSCISFPLTKLFLESQMWTRFFLEGITGSSSPLSVVDLSGTCNLPDSVESFLLVLEVTSFHPFTSPEAAFTLGLGAPFYLLLPHPHLTATGTLKFLRGFTAIITVPGSCSQKAQKLPKQNCHICSCPFQLCSWESPQQESLKPCRAAKRTQRPNSLDQLRENQASWSFVEVKYQLDNCKYLEKPKQSLCR